MLHHWGSTSIFLGSHCLNPFKSLAQFTLYENVCISGGIRSKSRFQVHQVLRVPAGGLTKSKWNNTLGGNWLNLIARQLNNWKKDILINLTHQPIRYHYEERGKCNCRLYFCFYKSCFNLLTVLDVGAIIKKQIMERKRIGWFRPIITLAFLLFLANAGRGV